MRPHAAAGASVTPMSVQVRPLEPPLNPSLVGTLSVVEVRVLGPLEVVIDGRVVDLGARKQRSLVAALALHRGRAVSTGLIVDALWGEEPPTSHAVTLQGYVSDVRKVLEPSRTPRGAGTVVVTSAAGYALALPRESFDDHALDEAVRRAAAAFATRPGRPWEPSGPTDLDELLAVAALLDDALAAWRGEPYADLRDEFVVAERARLHEARVTALELREAIRSHTGGSAEAARRLEPVALDAPHRERLWLLYAVALVRAGRQTDALAALRRFRDTLRDDLGVDPTAALSAVETEILRGALDGVTASPAASSVPTDLRVALVDDHPVFRMGMANLLGSLDGITVVGVAGDADAARSLVDDDVDIVLMDLDLGSDSGIDLTAELVQRLPGLHVLVMTMHEDDEYVRAALRAGAAGYLVKSAEPDDVLRALLSVARGELIIGASAARAMRDRLREPQDPA